MSISELSRSVRPGTEFLYGTESTKAIPPLGVIYVGEIPLQRLYAGESFMLRPRESALSPMDRARIHFSQVIHANDISAEWIASTMGTSEMSLSRFKHGKANLNLTWLIAATEQYIDPHTPDPNFEGLRRARNELEEPQWLQILSDPTLSIGNALELLRISQLLSEAEFTSRAHIRRDEYNVYELDKYKPPEKKLKKILAVSPLDEYGKPAQLIRLKKERMKPLHVADLQTSELGEICHYLRVIRGIPVKKIADTLFFHRQTIHLIEKGELKLRKDILPKLLKLLGVDSKRALGSIIQTRAEDPNAIISTSLLQKVVEEGDIVLQEHIPSDTNKRLTPQEEEIYTAVEREDTTNGMLRALRIALGIHQNAYTETGKRYGNFGVPRRTIQDIESFAYVPRSIIIARLIKQYTNWDINHPISRLITNVARRERLMLAA